MLIRICEIHKEFPSKKQAENSLITKADKLIKYLNLILLKNHAYLHLGFNRKATPIIFSETGLMVHVNDTGFYSMSKTFSNN
jgi:hypothetical protein